MKEKNIVKRVIDYLGDQSINIRIRMMFFLEYAVLLACSTGTICMILLKQPVSSLLPNVMLFTLSFIGLYLSRVKKNYDLSMMVMVFGCANIAVPWMFFSAGGNHSGMQIWLLFSVIVTCMMSSGKSRIFMVIVTILEDLGCICIGEIYPNVVTPLIGENAEFYDQLQSYAVACASLAGMLIIYISTYDNQGRKLEAQSIELRNLMQTDVMTGVFNRRAYYERINEYQQGVRPENLVLVAMDVNGLKRINDAMGHAAGDAYICEASKVISKAMGEYGQIFRIGGDEFMAILQCPNEKAIFLESRLQGCIDSLDNEWAGKMAIAVGVVCFSEKPGADFTEIEKLADQKMYENKAAYYKRNGIERRR